MEEDFRVLMMVGGANRRDDTDWGDQGLRILGFLLKINFGILACKGQSNESLFAELEWKFLAFVLLYSKTCRCTTIGHFYSLYFTF